MNTPLQPRPDTLPEQGQHLALTHPGTAPGQSEASKGGRVGQITSTQPSYQIGSTWLLCDHGSLSATLSLQPSLQLQHLASPVSHAVCFHYARLALQCDVTNQLQHQGAAFRIYRVIPISVVGSSQCSSPQSGV